MSFKILKLKLDKMLFVPLKIFTYIKKLKIRDVLKAEIITQLCRVNTLSTIKIAGSGHLGTSFSAMDIFVWISHFVINKKKKDFNRDIFFSSKGHDVPAFYNVLFSLGIIKFNKILRLRRLNGLDGHPDVRINGIEFNTGSLGMGISKAKGISWAKKYLKKKGLSIVITGDGEFQEGQIYESLQTTSAQNIKNLLVIMDHNKIQSSQFVKDIINIEPLVQKIKSFGWHVERCNGNSMVSLSKTLKRILKKTSKPKFLIADTIKGKGISFIEHPNYMKKNKNYNWHSGAPNNIEFDLMQQELKDKIVNLLKENKILIYPFINLSEKNKDFNSIEIH